MKKYFFVTKYKVLFSNVDHGDLKYGDFEDNKQSKIAMSHCYFRLFVVFKITIFKIAMIFYAWSM